MDLGDGGLNGSLSPDKYMKRTVKMSGLTSADYEEGSGSQFHHVTKSEVDSSDEQSSEEQGMGRGYDISRSPDVLGGGRSGMYGAKNGIVQYTQGPDGLLYLTNSPGTSILSRELSPSMGNPTIEEASRKRELRLLKNKEAAKECRRKKKEYVKCLENRVGVLEAQNRTLIEELKALKELYCQKDNKC